MKKILVPCDFSEQAIHAFRFALDVASQSQGSVNLIHVIQLPVLHDSMLMPVLYFEGALLKELRENAGEQFKELTEKYKAEDVNVEYEVKFGAISPMILNYMEEHAIDVIIMGTKGATGLREVFIGSNAEKVVRNSPVPVITVKEYPKAGSIHDIVFPNVLEIEGQEELVRKVKALQSFFNAKLHIVWINTPTNFTPDAVTKQRLQAFAKHFMIEDYTVNIYNDLYEEAGIINFTHECKAQMIAMGTHGRKGLAHILSGSIAEDVVNRIDYPIWTYSIKK